MNEATKANQKRKPKRTFLVGDGNKKSPKNIPAVWKPENHASYLCSLVQCSAVQCCVLSCKCVDDVVGPGNFLKIGRFSQYSKTCS